MMGAPRDDVPSLAAELARETARVGAASERIKRALAENREAEEFTAAEMRWLISLADYLDYSGGDYGDDTMLQRTREFARAEADAWLNFVRTPTPTVADLPRKVLAIERRATEVAQDEAEPLHLVEGLAQLRADLLRLARA